MSRYTDACPLLSKGVTLAKFKTDNPQPVEPGIVNDNEPGKAKVTAIYNALLSMEQGNLGYSGIARLCRVRRRWVVKVHRQMKRAEGVAWDS